MCKFLLLFIFVFFFKQKTAYEMRISDWSSDVCSSDLDEAVERRIRFLEGYQGKALARCYREFVERVQRAEAKAAPGRDALTAAVAHAYFKLLAYKDEYEVARLYAESDFLKRLHRSFEGDFKLKFHLAPPILAKPDPDTGEDRKSTRLNSSH